MTEPGRTYTLTFGDDFDEFERDWIDKGWYSQARVEFEGRLYELDIYDPVRLQQQVLDGISSAAGFFVETNLIVVAQVDRSHIEQAVAALSQRGFRDVLPTEPRLEG